MEVAKLIWKSWNEGKKLGPLSEKMKPNSRKEAYKIQEQIEIVSENKILGRKIAATSKDAQNHIGVSGPLAGRIFKDRAKFPNSNLILGNNQMAVAEPEFAFKIGTEIKPNNSYYKIKEVMELEPEENFERHIVKIAPNKKLLTYYETQYQFVHQVLERPDEYFNDNILGKFYTKDFEL